MRTILLVLLVVMTAVGTQAQSKRVLKKIKSLDLFINHDLLQAGLSVPVEIRCTLDDGSQLSTNEGFKKLLTGRLWADGKIELKDFKIEVTNGGSYSTLTQYVGKFHIVNDLLSLSDRNLQVKITLIKKPEITASYTLPLGFKSNHVLNFNGFNGQTGHANRTQIRHGRNGRDYYEHNNGENGENGADGAAGNRGGNGYNAVDVAFSLKSVYDNDGTRLIYARVKNVATGKVFHRWYDPKHGSLTVNSNGGHGGPGGQGQAGGNGGLGGKGRHGGHGGDGGNGGQGGVGGDGGKGGNVEVFYFEDDKDILNTVFVNVNGGVGGHAGYGGNGGNGGKGGDGTSSGGEGGRGGQRGTRGTAGYNGEKGNITMSSMGPSPDSN